MSLFEFIKNNQLDIIKEIIEKYSDSNKKPVITQMFHSYNEEESGYNKNALQCSCFYGRLEILKYLVSQGITIDDIMFAEEYDDTPLLIACDNNQLHIVMFLIQHFKLTRKNIMIPMSDGFTVLHLACYHGNLEILTYLANSGLKKEDFRVVDYYNCTPFYYACKEQNTIIVQYLLENWIEQSDVFITNHNGYSPYDKANKNIKNLIIKFYL